MGAVLLNTTPHAAAALPFLSGVGTLTLLVRGAWTLEGGSVVRIAEQPAELVGADLYDGKPEHGVVRYESDLAPFKPRADALCVGKAYVPHGVPVPECLVGFGVGSWFKVIRVVGDRRWVPALGGLSHRITEPEPFKSMLVSYENAFGGKDAGKPGGARSYPANPAGKGYSGNGGGLNDLLLPNLEDPAEPIKGWRSRPRPMSFGPVGRTWEPRVQKIGTYDRRWLKERSPNLPADFDEAFYNCAPEDQQIQGYLRGDEEVHVQNMHPEHPDLRFRLPGIRIRALVERKAGALVQLEEIIMNLDTLWVDMEALQLVLVWRGRFSDDRAESQSRVLVVEEPLEAPRRSPESYRPELIKHAAAEQEPEQTIAEAEKELAQIQAERAAVPAPEPEPEPGPE